MAIGDIKTIRVRGRIIKFKQVADEGFGMWKIISNEPSSNLRKVS